MFPKRPLLYTVAVWACMIATTGLVASLPDPSFVPGPILVSAIIFCTTIASIAIVEAIWVAWKRRTHC
jgi:hypothetical protein